jgi:hypothetical protein
MPDVAVEINTSTKVRDQLQSEVTRRLELFDERDKVMHQIRRYRLMRHKPYVPKGSSGGTVPRRLVASSGHRHAVRDTVPVRALHEHLR